MNLPKVTYAVFLSGAFVWCAAILLAPFLAGSSSPFAGVMYRLFQPVCHQLPDRSFHLFGGQLAVCSRCSSIYFAFLLGIIIYPIIRNVGSVHIPHRNNILLALLPMLVDVGLDMTGIHSSNFFTRTFSGMLFGFAAPFFVLPAAVEAVLQIAAPSPAINVDKQKGISNA